MIKKLFKIVLIMQALMFVNVVLFHAGIADYLGAEWVAWAIILFTSTVASGLLIILGVLITFEWTREHLVINENICKEFADRSKKDCKRSIDSIQTENNLMAV